MRKNEPISHIMSKKVESVQQGQPLSDVYKLMCNGGFHHIPVLDGSALKGLISFTDMMKLDVVIHGVDEHTLTAVMDQQFTIAGVMSTDLVTLKDNQSVRDAVELLGEGSFHSLPVTGSTGELMGMVTTTDLIRYLGEQY